MPDRYIFTETSIGLNVAHTLGTRGNDMDIKQMLFVCVENAGRSQMAEAFANQYGKGKVIASSAGVRLAEKVNPIVVEVMKERGIDIFSNAPKLLTPKIVEEAD
jgi:arsenate reductase